MSSVLESTLPSPPVANADGSSSFDIDDWLVPYDHPETNVEKEAPILDGYAGGWSFEKGPGGMHVDEEQLYDPHLSFVGSQLCINEITTSAEQRVDNSESFIELSAGDPFTGSFVPSDSEVSNIVFGEQGHCGNNGFVTRALGHAPQMAVSPHATDWYPTTYVDLASLIKETKPTIMNCGQGHQVQHPGEHTSHYPESSRTNPNPLARQDSWQFPAALPSFESSGSPGINNTEPQAATDMTTNHAHHQTLPVNDCSMPIDDIGEAVSSTKIMSLNTIAPENGLANLDGGDLQNYSPLLDGPMSNIANPEVVPNNIPPMELEDSQPQKREAISDLLRDVAPLASRAGFDMNGMPIRWSQPATALVEQAQSFASMTPPPSSGSSRSGTADPFDVAIQQGPSVATTARKLTRAARSKSKVTRAPKKPKDQEWRPEVDYDSSLVQEPRIQCPECEDAVLLEKKTHKYETLHVLLSAHMYAKHGIGEDEARRRAQGCEVVRWRCLRCNGQEASFGLIKKHVEHLVCPTKKPRKRRV